ncbi:ComEA family DNA-binding protein [Pseudomonas huanghezhanensis]|uniref:ComEA family DNA-binding protein n=1 Tax=Pseudomonas huanghezhanensis TaxID=3002903 RepID=UPI0022858127|nr:helix-hairpin-helix domain-containing protein [Pseudomonas sp. BSw22131]
MRTSPLCALAFAFLTSFSVLATAAPAAMVPANPEVVMQPAEQGAKVNLNTADAQTLQKELSGIGAGKAIAIVAYRDENGSFTSVDELIEVKGIGKAILDKNRDKLAIE